MRCKWEKLQVIERNVREWQFSTITPQSRASTWPDHRHPHHRIKKPSQTSSGALAVRHSNFYRHITSSNGHQTWQPHPPRSTITTDCNYRVLGGTAAVTGPRKRLTRPCQNGERHPASESTPKQHGRRAGTTFPFTAGTRGSLPPRISAIRARKSIESPETTGSPCAERGVSWCSHCATGRTGFEPGSDGSLRKGTSLWKSVFRPFGVRLVKPTFGVYGPFRHTRASAMS